MGKPNWLNRTLFHGDNLLFLRAMNSESVDLVATDPPFNKSRDFHATPDSLAAGASFQDRWSWERDVHQDWVDQITDDYPRLMEAIESARSAHSDGMGAFMCFMAVRLLEMRRVLKPTGSIYLHCDPTASHYLKAVIDAVFGKDSYRNEIIWKRSHSHNSAKRYGPVHDVILFYTKSAIYTWGNVRQDYDPMYVDRYFKFDDNDGRGRYWTGDLTGSGKRDGATGQEWRGFNPTAKGRHWMVPPDKLDDLDRNRRIYWPPTDGAWPKLKRYLSEAKGIPLQDVVSDIYGLSRMGATRRESSGYPTQKPLALYDRIIKSSSNKGDIVFDPFAGCATTLVAAEKLHRQWVGIDIWKNTHGVVLQRLETEGLIETASSRDKRHGHIFAKDIIFTSELPVRTDDGEPAAPNLRTKIKVFEPRGPKMTRAEMYKHLLGQHGIKCQGCDRTFDDPRYLELDHNTPRSDGGINHISNRILLCGPCNRLKSNTLTLTGLRRKNKKEGYMAGQDTVHPIMREIREKREKAPPLFE